MQGRKSKIFLLVAALLGALSGSASLAVAGGITPGTVPTPGDYGVQGSVQISDAPGLLGILAKVVQATYTVFFIIAIFILLLVAFHYLLFGNDPQEVKKARDWLIYAGVAIVLALIAVAASTIIRTFIAPGNNP